MNIRLGLTPENTDCSVSPDDLHSVSIESREDTDYRVLLRRLLDGMSRNGARLLVVDPEDRYRDLVADPDDHTVTDLISMINRAGSLTYTEQNAVLVIDRYSFLTRGLPSRSLSAVEDALIYLHRHAHHSGVSVIIANDSADLHLPYYPETMMYVGVFNMRRDQIMIPRAFRARVYAAVRESTIVPRETMRDHGVIVTDIIREFTLTG